MAFFWFVGLSLGRGDPGKGFLTHFALQCFYLEYGRVRVARVDGLLATDEDALADEPVELKGWMI